MVRLKTPKGVVVEVTDEKAERLLATRNWKPATAAKPKAAAPAPAADSTED